MFKLNDIAVEYIPFSVVYMSNTIYWILSFVNSGCKSSKKKKNTHFIWDQDVSLVYCQFFDLEKIEMHQ